MNVETEVEDKNMWAVGWSAFAAITLVLVGAGALIEGVVALVDDEFYVVGEEWVFEFDLTTWGWIHIILGVALVASGIGVLFANVVARTVGVIVAALAMISNFAWMPYYPLWSITLIAISVAVIWALTVHGRDIAKRSGW